MISCTKLAHLSLSLQQCWCGLAFRERCPVLWCQVVTSSWHFPVLTLETRWLSSARHNTQHADVSKMSHVAACYCTVVLRDLCENPRASTVIINELKWAAQFVPEWFNWQCIDIKYGSYKRLRCFCTCQFFWKDFVLYLKISHHKLEAELYHPTKWMSLIGYSVISEFGLSRKRKKSWFYHVYTYTILISAVQLKNGNAFFAW